jgi:hypothetical protein
MKGTTMTRFLLALSVVAAMVGCDVNVTESKKPDVIVKEPAHPDVKVVTPPAAKPDVNINVEKK